VSDEWSGWLVWLWHEGLPSTPWGARGSGRRSPRCPYWWLPAVPPR